MKKFFAIAALFIIACSSGPKPENIAEEFLNAYLATDYQKAASYCTPALSQDMLKALEEAEALDQEIQAKIKMHTQNYKPQIDSTVQNRSKDSIIVYYSILNNTLPDSLSTSATQIIESVLTIVKQDEEWKVGSLNK